MALVLKTEFWQHGLESQVSKDPQGVCFREAFKWLACKIYNLPFKFDFSNPHKVIAKQQAYLKPIQPFEGKQAKFESFFTNVHRISQQTLDQWGNKNDTKTGAVKYRLRFETQVVLFTLAGCDAFKRDAQMVVGLYGNTDKAGPWAHAVAFYRKGNEIDYFDANGGEFGFDSDAHIGSDLMDNFRHRNQPYVGFDSGVTYTLERFGLYKAIKG